MKRKLILHNQVIIVDTRTGDGLDNLFSMLSKKLLYLANSYYVDGYTTDDKVQSMRIKILAIIPKYSAEKSTFATYVERCLKNMIKDDIKHNSRAEKYITNYPLEKLGWYVSIDEKDR